MARRAAGVLLILLTCAVSAFHRCAPSFVIWRSMPPLSHKSALGLWSPPQTMQLSLIAVLMTMNPRGQKRQEVIASASSTLQ